MKKTLIKKFKFKISLLFFIALFIPVIAFFALNYFDTQNYEEDIAKKINEDNSQNQVEVFEYWIRNKEKNLSLLVDLLEYHIRVNGINESMNKVLDEMVVRDKDIINAYYTAESGENYLSGGQDPVVDGRERDWYKNALASEISISEPYEDALTGELVVTFSAVIRNYGDQINGVLGVDVLFSNVIDKFFRVFDDNLTEIQILSKDGEMLFSSSLEEHNDDEKERIVKDIESIEVELVLMRENRSSLYLGISIAFLAILSLFLIFQATNVLNEPIDKLEKSILKIVEGCENEGEVERSKYKDLDDILSLFVEMNEYIEKNTKSIETMRVDLDERNKTLSRLNLEYEKAYKELEIFSLELSNKEREYENLVENIMNYIWIIDLNGKISYANERLLNRLGYESINLLEKPFSEIVPDFRSEEDLYKILIERDYDSIDMRFLSKNGKEEILTSSRTKRIYRDNRIISVQGISRNITNEKEMEKELSIKNRDLILINKISKEMAISNNLNSILNLILKEINSLIDIECSSIRILSEGTLSLKAFSGDERKLLFSKDSADALESHVGYSIINNEVLIINGIEDIKDEKDKKIIGAVRNGARFAIIPIISGTNLIGALSIITRKKIDKRIESVLLAFANSAAISLEKALLYEKLEVNYMKTIKALITAMEAKNSSMQGHSHRVSVMAKLIAENLYLNESEVRDIHMAALLHDIGKIGIKDSVIRKSEWIGMENSELVKLHVETGKKILTPIKLKNTILDGVYYHHKRYDGSGYPADDVITPLSAQIIGIADKLDELLNSSSNMGFKDIKEYFSSQRGKKFSNELVNIILEIIDTKDAEFVEIYSSRIR